jgi:hypothetical protein
MHIIPLQTGNAQINALELEAYDQLAGDNRGD